MGNNEQKVRTIQEWNSLFESIYKQHYKKLCVFANSYTSDEDEAEEIVQRVITKLWEQRDSYDSIENLNSYLFRSVKNHCLNTISHKKIEEKYQSEAWNELKLMEIKAIEDNLQEEKEQKLKKAIDELPERCQDVLKLSKFEGLKNKEIAEKLQISVKAVEANITRAFSALRKALK